MQVAEFLRQSRQKLVTCLPDDPLHAVAKAMYAHDIGAMPVFLAWRVRARTLTMKLKAACWR